MSRVDDLRERFKDDSPAYSMQGTIQRHQKELLLEILCELAEMNDRAKEEAATKKESQVPPRQKVTPSV